MNFAIQFRPAQVPPRGVLLPLPLPRKACPSSTLSFHTLTNATSRNSVPLTSLQMPRGCGGGPLFSLPISSLKPLTSALAAVPQNAPITPLECAVRSRLLSAKQKAPGTPLESALTSHFQFIENACTLSPAESTLTDMSPATLLESALTKMGGVGGRGSFPSRRFPQRPPRPASRRSTAWTGLSIKNPERLGTFNLRPLATRHSFTLSRTSSRGHGSRNTCHSK